MFGGAFGWLVADNSGSVAVLAAVAAACAVATLKSLERFGYLRTPTAWKLEAEALNARILDLERTQAMTTIELASVKAENQLLRQRPDLSSILDALEAHDKFVRKTVEMMSGWPGWAEGTFTPTASAPDNTLQT